MNFDVGICRFFIGCIFETSRFPVVNFPDLRPGSDVDLIPLGRVPRQHDPRLGTDSLGTRSGGTNEVGLSHQVLTFFISFQLSVTSWKKRGS